MLYKTDDFGCIKNSSGGIEISENSSPATISIALLLADKVMNHQPFIISCSDVFKKSFINAAIYDDLPVYFADPFIQDLFLHQNELMDNERNSFIYNGDTNRLNPKPFIMPFNRQTIETVANIRLRLPTLSQLPLVHSKSQGTGLLERKKSRPS